jgi:hypothetical protein
MLLSDAWTARYARPKRIRASIRFACRQSIKPDTPWGTFMLLSLCLDSGGAGATT